MFAIVLMHVYLCRTIATNCCTTTLAQKEMYSSITQASRFKYSPILAQVYRCKSAIPKLSSPVRSDHCNIPSYSTELRSRIDRQSVLQNSALSSRPRSSSSTESLGLQAKFLTQWLEDFKGKHKVCIAQIS